MYGTMVYSRLILDQPKKKRYGSGVVGKIIYQININATTIYNKMLQSHVIKNSPKFTFHKWNNAAI